jgi:translation initiation factor IF-2
MADVTVGKLAETINTPVDRLLQQMAEAGLSQQKAADTVSNDEKQKLLAYLKSSHGETPGEAPRKITLKRTTISTLKAPTATGKKNVSVEVRQKRTYIKRDEADIKAQQELEEQRRREEEDEAAAAASESTETPTPATPPVTATTSSPVDDIELKRQAAAHARKSEEEKQKLERQAVQDRKTAANKPKPGSPTAPGSAPGTIPGAKKFGAPAKPPVGKRAASTDDDEDLSKPRKKAGRGGVRSDSDKIDIYRLLTQEEEEARRTAIKSALRADVKFNNRHTFKKPTATQVHEVLLTETIKVTDLAQQMAVKATEVIKVLMKLGIMATINESIDRDTAQLVVEEMGHTFRLVSANDAEDMLVGSVKGATGNLETRAPVVTVMGHVDHGKTSLLDYIRKTKVASGEAGGITQHIGAYSVEMPRGRITFLDTPGHAAFTAMRARGAKSTDVVVLVVAADDGVMPQTEEAVQHAKAAGVPMVVAINKMDKASADPDRVRTELSQLNVISEEWGGDTQFIPVSAHTGSGIDKLLEAISLQAEMLELKASSDVPGTGVVVEARLDKGRGTVATVLVQNGTLKKGDILLAGNHFGRVRAMINDQGKEIDSAGPSTPVEVLGLDDTPNAGDEFLVMPDEKSAREVAALRLQKESEARLQRHRTVNLENLFANTGAEEKKTLRVFLKTDVRGSLEAILASLGEMGNNEVEVKIVGSGVGGITESDVNLALSSKAIVIGFNVRAEAAARKTAELEGVEIRYYSIIYNLLDDVKQALSGMLTPERVEEIVGIAEVRDTFRSPKFGQVAGCMVTEGVIQRNKRIRVLRNNVVTHEGEIDSLRRFKDDVSEVRNGMECGIGVKDYDVKVGDLIEVYNVKQIARSL